MKGVIKPDHMPVNKYELIVPGLPTLVFTTISGLEDELQTVDMPDRTVRSGGNRGPVEFTATQPMHHTVERAAMEVWYREAQDPVLPSAYKVGTLVHKSNSGAASASYTLIDLFPTKRKLPDLEMANEGEEGEIEWTFKASDVIPI